MPYRTLAFVCLCLSLTGCLRTSKPQTMETRCTHALDQARQRYTANAKTADPSDLALADHLIGAARIARQHHEFIYCLERSSRAISLLRHAAATGTASADH